MTADAQGHYHSHPGAFPSANEKTKAHVKPLLSGLLPAAGGRQATLTGRCLCLHSVRLSACPIALIL